MDKIDILLTRGVDKIYPSKAALEKVLRSGKKLRLYQGFDPTGTELHIGHMVGFRKLAQFQDLGHKVIFLIGDFTGMIGDPTGKFSERKQLTRKQVLENAKTYKEQASRILRFEGKNSVEIKYNSEWLAKMSAMEFLRLSHHLTAQQIIERDMFQKRLKEKQDVFMNEFLYPFMQGYDSVAMNIDLEIGGIDQMFNMLMGRKLMRNILRKEKFVMTTPLLTDSKGVKIGKSEGNVIGLTDKPQNLFGKVMALGDDVILKGFEYLTDVPIDEMKKIKKEIEKGSNPMVFKKRLAFAIVAQLNNKLQAEEAQSFFETTFQQSKLPTSSVRIYKVGKKNVSIVDLLIGGKFASSKSQARRLVMQGAVEINSQKITDPTKIISIVSGDIVRMGKSKFAKLEI